MAGGELPAAVVTKAHAARARELGLCATNMPVELGGGGCTTLQQVLVQEQVGRVTNALGWVAATPPSWLPAVATAGPARAVRAPGHGGRAGGVLRDHRGGRGLRRGGDRGDGPPGRRRLPARMASSGTSRRTTPPTSPSSRPSWTAARTTASTRCSSWTCPAPASAWCGHRPTRTRSATTTRSSRSRRARSRRQPDRRGGRRHGLRLRVVPVRAADGGGPLPGRRRAADRGDDRVRRPSGGQAAGRSASTAWSAGCSRTA